MDIASKYNRYPVEPSAARPKLREFALAVHDIEGVGPACVFLQDRMKLDVDVLLLAAYVGAVRGQILTRADVDAARELIEPWRNEIVQPLRAVRRRLKSGPSPAPDADTEAVRKQVAKAELDAELVELNELGTWVDGLRSPQAHGSPAERAMAAMDVAVRAYYSEAVAEDDRVALTTIAAAAAHGSEAQ